VLLFLQFELFGTLYFGTEGVFDFVWGHSLVAKRQRSGN
jgi:hypothetical protein